MNASVKLGKIWGIPIGLHLSWFLVFGLLAWSLAIGYFPNESPQFSSQTHLILAVMTSVLFFASVLAHELGHSFVALRESIPVKGITLFIFGGVAQIGQEPRSPGAEFRIAIAGPLVSLGLAGVFAALSLFDRQIPLLAEPGLYLARINLILALFNMIPGFPLDGGRVLRAIVWYFTKSFRQATQVASISGQVVAFGFIGLGVFSIFGGQFVNGLWLAFIGWFLQNAAASAYAQVNLREALHGITVSQAMARDCSQISGLTPISQIIQEYVLAGGRRCFYVSDAGQLRGTISMKDIKRVPRPKWRFITAEQVMVPFNRLMQVEPETELVEALQTMDDQNLEQVSIVKDKQLLGTLSREQVVHYLRLRSEMGV